MVANGKAFLRRSTHEAHDTLLQGSQQIGEHELAKLHHHSIADMFCCVVKPGRQGNLRAKERWARFCINMFPLQVSKAIILQLKHQLAVSDACTVISKCAAIMQRVDTHTCAAVEPQHSLRLLQGWQDGGLAAPC